MACSLSAVILTYDCARQLTVAGSPSLRIGDGATLCPKAVLAIAIPARKRICRNLCMEKPSDSPLTSLRDTCCWRARGRAYRALFATMESAARPETVCGSRELTESGGSKSRSDLGFRDFHRRSILRRR